MGETLTCKECARSFERQSHKGKAPLYCSSACYQRAHYVPTGGGTRTVFRASQLDMVERLDDLYDICDQHEPLTVRQAYYRAVVAHLVPKSESGYGMVQRALLELRRTGLRDDTRLTYEDGDSAAGYRLPYAWIVDNTRWMRKPKTYGSAENALANTAATYRRELWDASDFYLEVWCESDSIAGVATGVTSRWDTPLMVTRGFSSETFAYNAAQEFQERADAGKEIIVIYIGDLDPAGLKIESKLHEIIEANSTLTIGPDINSGDIAWRRLFVTQVQRDVTMTHLQPLGTPAKGTKQFPWIGGVSIEAEAIAPGVFRTMLETEIDQYVDHRRLEILGRVEAEEKAIMQRMKLRPTRKLSQLRGDLEFHDDMRQRGIDPDNPEGYMP